VSVILNHQAQPPYLERSKSFKSELFDTADVEEKLLQKDQDMLEMKKSVKLKVLKKKLFTNPN